MKNIIIFVSLILSISLTPSKSFAGHIWASEQDTVNVYELNQLDTLFVCYQNGKIHVQAGYTDDGGCYSWVFPSMNTHEQFIELYDAAVEGSTNYGVQVFRCDGNNRGFRLIFVMPSTSTQNITICQGDIYTIGSHTYTDAGTYIDTIPAVNTCDSIVTTNLSINNSSTATQNISACDSYSWFSSTYTTSGTHTHIIQNAAGCDSTITLNLIIKNSSVATQTVSACNSYTWFGTTYNSSGTHTHTIPNAAGCDSTITLNLTINPVYNIPITASINQGQTYTLPDNSIVNSTGIYTTTLQTQNGCDSIIVTNLTVLVSVPLISNTVEFPVIYPNPVNDNLTIETITNSTIEIINSRGQIVKKMTLINSKNNIDLKELIGGVYTLRIKNENGIIVKKLIKQ